MEPIEFKAGHNNIGEIKIEETKCDVCNNKKICITIDSSEGEYGHGAICKDCTTKLFSEYDDSL